MVKYRYLILLFAAYALGAAFFMWEEIGSFSYLDVQLGKKSGFFIVNDIEVIFALHSARRCYYTQDYRGATRDLDSLNHYESCYAEPLLLRVSCVHPLFAGCR